MNLWNRFWNWAVEHKEGVEAFLDYFTWTAMFLVYGVAYLFAIAHFDDWDAAFAISLFYALWMLTEKRVKQLTKRANSTEELLGEAIEGMKAMREALRQEAQLRASRFKI